MICIIALPVFLVLGLFSLKYRILAKEAFDCVFRTITFRKCQSNLDQRIKSKVTGKILKYHPGTAKFVFRHFEILSIIFMVMLILSTAYSGIGVYNYVKYGNCNGKASVAFCIFNPLGTNQAAAAPALTNATNCSPPDNAANLLQKNGT